MLDLTSDVEEAGDDDLLANADRLAAEDKTVEASSEAPRKRPVLGGDDNDAGSASGAAVGGSTLFERMANLSRGSGSEEDEEGDDDAPALSIPRFLGRQNNQ